jgi:hypothetical protein
VAIAGYRAVRRGACRSGREFFSPGEDSALFKRTGADQLPAIVILDRTGAISGPALSGMDANPPQNRRLVNLLADRLNALLGAK